MLASIAVKIRRIDSRRDDIRAAMAELRARLSPGGTWSARRAASARLRSSASRFRRCKWLSGFAATWPPRASPRYWTIRPGSTRHRLRPATCECRQPGVGRRPCRGRSQFDRGRSTRGRKHPRFPAGDPAPRRPAERPDGYLLQRYRPLGRVGICVPGGAAAYPSTVLMTAVPAQVAGVPELAVVAPPTKFGAYNPDLLATCHELGITEVYRLGGAQAVAALAYGIEGIPRSTKSSGPAICSWRWPRNTSSARWRSIRLPVRVKWW